MIDLELEFYSILHIFTYLEDKDWNSIAKLNHKFNRIATGNLGYELKRKYGNITEFVYEQRVRNWFSPKLFECKSDLTWKSFHSTLQKHYMNIHNQSYIQRCCTDNNLFELKLLNVFDINPIPDNLNIAAQYGNLNIIKFYAPTILPTTYGAYLAKHNQYFEIVEFLKEYGIHPVDPYAFNYGNGNIAVGYNALTALTTGQQNTAVGYNCLVTTGTNNIAIGYNCITTGNNNTVIGY